MLAIHQEWATKAAAVERLTVPLEKTDVSVAELALVWVPVANA